MEQEGLGWHVPPPLPNIFKIIKELVRKSVLCPPILSTGSLTVPPPPLSKLLHGPCNMTMASGVPLNCIIEELGAKTA